VAGGTFALHQFDRAAIVAGFAFSTNQTTGSGWQPHVLLGVQYYIRLRDSFPGTTGRGFAVLGGISLNSLNTYFVGGAWEPSQGFNVASGLSFARDAHTFGPFLMLGLDVDVFRKIFGKATGIGTAPSVNKSLVF
jgi:hypothetical protein